MELTLATGQAHNTVPLSSGLAAYLSQFADHSVRFLEDLCWEDAYSRLVEGSLPMAWICGRPYIDLIDQIGASIQLLVAPVMAGQRYLDSPIYFSDVIVRQDSPYYLFEDLRGASWACNEPGSQSGYHITRYHLATLGESGDYFGRVVFTGAHRMSIQQVLSGEIDASAIDSTVLEWELAENPSLQQKIRVVSVFGPSPIPPIVISATVPGEVREALKRLLLDMPNSVEGRRVLASGFLSRFESVSDSDYDPIRQMAERAADVILEPMDQK